MRRCLLPLLLVHATALTNPAFTAGSAAFQTGDLRVARRHFEESKRLFPDDAATRAVLSKLDELGIESARSDDDEVISYRSCQLRLKGGKRTIRVLCPADDRPIASSAGDTSGVQVWTCAMALIDWLSDHQEMVRGTSALELGSGTGIVGNAFAAYGASHVCMTDLPHMLPLLNANADANRDDAVDGTVEVAPLCWGQMSGPLFERPWGLICAADVCYDAGLVPPLGATLRALLSAQPSATALLALSDLQGGVAGSDRPNYALLLDELRDGFATTRVASVPGAEALARHEGEVPIADAHRSHAIDIFTVKKESKSGG